MYFRNIYKTLQQLERNRTKVEKLQETVLWVALTKFIFLFHLHNFVVSWFQFNWLLFYKTRLYIRWAYFRNNIFVSKWMGLNPEGRGEL